MLKIVNIKKNPQLGIFLGLLCLFLNLLMLSLFATPLAILFQLNFFLYKLLVFAGPVVDALTSRAGELYESIL